MGALFGFSGPPDEGLFQRMAEALAHRGRGSVVRYVGRDASLGVRSALGAPTEQRLSTGLVQDGSITLAFAGYLTGSERGSRTLHELVARYRERGTAFVDELRGAFVLAVADGARLLLARDGVGVRTLYWGRHAGRTLFAVEPKGVLAAPGFPRRLRRAAVAEYLSFSFVPGAKTMLEDLFELLPGHVLELDGDREPRLVRWFCFESEPEAPAEPEATEQWVERFREGFERAIDERRPSGEPVGVYLSGGLDSSVVTAALAARHDAPVKSYALHFGREFPHELGFAKAVAERCRTEHQEVLLRPKDFLPRLRRIIWHLDDPIGDPITVPNFELSQRVAGEVRFVFNGEGGDPVFGGPKNIPMLLHHWYGGIERDSGFRARMYLSSYRRGYEELPRLLAPAWGNAQELELDLERIIQPYFEAEQPRSFLNKLCAINIRLKAAHLILPKVERMTGAFRLVTASPLFDERLVRLSFQMPPRLKLDRGIEKIVLKRAYQDELPREVIERPKSGMRVPVHYWFQGEMKRYAKKLLAPRELKKAGIFDPERVARLLAYDTEEGPGRYGIRLWMLLTFEIWRRIVIEGEAP